MSSYQDRMSFRRTLAQSLAAATLLLSALAIPAAANPLFDTNYCTTNHCRTTTDQDGTVIWVTIALDDNYIDVPIDADSNSVIDGWERISLYIEHQGVEYLVSNFGESDWTDNAPSNLEIFNQAMQTGNLRLRKGPNFNGGELFTEYKGAWVRLGFNSYQGYSVSDVNLLYNQVTVKRPIVGTGNREGGQCHEIFVADVVDLNEYEGIALITENTVSPDGSTVLFGQGFFGRALVCADTPPVDTTAPLWVLDGRGGKRFLGEVGFEIIDERVDGSEVAYTSVEAPVIPISEVLANVTDPVFYQCIADTYSSDQLTSEIESLYCEGDIRGLSGIEGFTHLKRLEFNGSQLESIDEIGTLSTLEQLWIHNGSPTFTDLSVLPGLRFLDHLSLQDGALTTESIQVLADMTQLVHLRLNYNEIDDISVLSNLKNVTYLEFACNNVADYSPIGGMTALTNLLVWCAGANQSADLNWVSGLTSLKRFGFEGGGIRDISAVTSLEALEYLNLQHNELETLNWGAGPTTITEAHLDGNQLQSLDGVQALGNLQQLHANQNLIDDLSALTSLDSLQVLWLQYNRISNISPLKNLVDLDQLVLEENRVSAIGGTFDAWVNGTHINLNNNPLFCSELNGLLANSNLQIEFVTDCYETFLPCDGYCIETADRLLYRFAIRDEAETYVFERSMRDASLDFAGGLVGGAFEFELDGEYLLFDTRDANGDYQTSEYFDAREVLLSQALRSSDALSLRLSPAGQVDNTFRIDGLSKQTDLTLINEQGLSVDQIVVQNSYVQMTRLLAGSGTRADNQCSEFPINEFAEGVSQASQTLLIPDDLVEGGTMDLLGFGGENSFYLCSDTPVGVYPITFQVIDGRGGKIEIGLTIEVLETQTSGGSLAWSAGIDSDLDGTPDEFDAFPEDPSEWADSDGDGVGDNGDFWPDDASRQYPSIDEVLANVTDPIFYQCIADNYSSDQLTSGIESLYCDGDIRRLTGIEGFTNLKQLEVNGSQLESIDEVGALSMLEQLTIHNGSPTFTDLSVLPGLRFLNHLSLQNGALTTESIQVLADMTHLVHLRLNYNQIDDISVLNVLKDATYLEFGCNNVADYSPIGGMTALTDLLIWCAGANQSTDLNWVSELTSLKRFGFEGGGIRDISAVASLEALEYLNLQHNELETLNWGSGLTNLAEIHLDGNQLQSLDGVQQLVNLQQLHANGNLISDLSALTSLSSLEVIWLHSNQISDIGPLKNLVNLDQLVLWDNGVSAIGDTFDAWSNGTYIDLSENPLACSELAAARENQNIEIDFRSECLPDGDGDGVPDDLDAFPEDPAASRDSDGDGAPDDWNEGYSAEDSTSGLLLDEAPFDPDIQGDRDQDGVDDSVDLNPDDPVVGRDSDGDGLPDVCDSACLSAGYTEDNDDDNDNVDDASDAFPLDPSETSDTDGDGVGDSTDADDDGDDFNDQTEISAGTDPLDAAEYPYSGGRVGLVYLSDYGDRNRDFVEVLVARHGSSQGEVSIDYTTVAGGAARPGEHFEMVSGTLTWADGDQATKIVQVPLVGEPGGTNAQYDFGVLLENLVGNAKYDATAGRVVLHDDRINPDWSGNLLTPYRTVVSKDGEAFLRVDRVGGSRGSLSATIGSEGVGWFGTNYAAPFEATVSWADGEVGSKYVQVEIDPDYMEQSSNRRYQTLPLYVVRIESIDGAAQWWSTPWYEITDPEQNFAYTQVLLQFAEDVDCYATFDCEGFEFNAGNYYWSDYDTDPVWWIYRIGEDEGELSTSITVTTGEVIELFWGHEDVSPIRVTHAPDRSDPDSRRWTSYAITQNGAQALTFVSDFAGTIADLAATDSDEDGISNLEDDDADNDGFPDVIDSDADNDGLSNEEEIVNGRGNWLDADSDDDGTPDADDEMPFDPNETRDADGDGIGDNADEDDDNDGAPDDIELAQGTDPFDASSYPGSGGLISAHAELVGAFNRGDGQGSMVEVRVNRLLSGDGAVSVDFSTVDGVHSFAGEHYEPIAGTLTWGAGDRSEKIITIPVTLDPDGRARVFSVQLMNPQGGAQLGAWHVAAVVVGDLNYGDAPGGFVHSRAYGYRFEEGGRFEIPISRSFGRDGAIDVGYQIAGCEAQLDPSASSPVVGTLSWADGDQSDQVITLQFVDDDQPGDATGHSCFGTVQFTPPENETDTHLVISQLGRPFSVLDNDFPNEGVVTWAQRTVYVEEGSPSIEQRLIRLGPAASYASTSVFDPDWIYGSGQVYAGTYGYAIPGIHYESVGQQGGLFFEWGEFDRGIRSFEMPLAADNDYASRNRLILNQLTVNETGWNGYFYGFILDYDLDGRELRDTDGDGTPDSRDLDLDGDGVFNEYDTDIDGDGIDNDVDSHRFDARQSVDSDADGLGDNFDWAPNDPSEQFDSDGDGIGNNVDDNDDGDACLDDEDQLPLDASECFDSDFDGIGDNADPDDDNDGYLDNEDWAPYDPSEWADTDGDGAGDNADPDADNDGALDANDAFPLDPRYALDVDSDGMADEWEAVYGLNASDPTDAYQDADTDGVLNLQEFLAETDPQDGGVDAQMLYTDKPATLIPGRSGRFTVNYTTNTDDPNLSGVGVRVHYDSSYVTSVTLDSIFATGLIGQSDEADIEDWDMDPATDRFILISWASFSGPAWPGELPTPLFDVVIESRQEIEALSSYVIRFSNAGSSEGYALSAPSVYNPVVLASLDIDGDGEAKALTDGLLVIRRLFGFSGTSLAAGAVSGSAVYATPDEIAERIDAFSEGLDVDDDGQTKALTDGLLIIRRLFGFSGDSLTAGAVGTEATRSDPDDIRDYIDSLRP